ncbi:unnamed protein product [Camellia sinensis]
MESSGSLPFDSKLQKSDRGQPDKVRSDGNEVGSDPSAAQVGKSKRKRDGQIKLPEKFEILGKFFDSLDSSIRLLRLKGSRSTFANISPKMECLTNRRFSYGHLAQLKFILPEVIEIKKILVHDEKTSCMKPDLHVTLNVDAIKNERKPNASGNSHMRKVFHARLLDFFKAHPKGEVPEETLPEPFNQLKQDVHISTAKASDPSLLHGTLADALAEQQPTAAASHLSQSSRKRFSQKISRSEAVDGYQGQPIVSLQPSVIPVPEPHFDQSSSEELTGASASKFSLKATTSQKCLPIGASRASILRSLPSATPKIEIDFGKNKVSSSVETAIIQGSPAKPALQPQKRCYVSPDDDSTSSPRKLVTRKPQSRSLKFDTPVKNTKVEDEVNNSGGLSVDNDIFDILPENLLQSIREKEKKTLEEQDPAISQAKRRYQMIASLPKLFDMILFLFQSIKRSVMTKEELMHRIVCSHLDIVDRREVEEQLKLLQELIPEWMYEKLASSGDIVVCINKISSPELMRARLVEAKDHQGWLLLRWEIGSSFCSGGHGYKMIIMIIDPSLMNYRRVWYLHQSHEKLWLEFPIAKEERGHEAKGTIGFRTPQHPSLGANNWGGASPLLARDIPKEALEQRYARLNSVRTRDEIFPAANDDSIYFPQAQAPKLGCPPKPTRRGFFTKLIWRPRKMKTITLGSGSKKRRWFPKWDPTNRWPQASHIVHCYKLE